MTRTNPQPRATPRTSDRNLSKLIVFMGSILASAEFAEADAQVSTAMVRACQASIDRFGRGRFAIHRRQAITARSRAFEIENEDREAAKKNSREPRKPRLEGAVEVRGRTISCESQQ
jgi:hypothetical protein